MGRFVGFLDVDYWPEDRGARAALVVASGWGAAAPYAEWTEDLDAVAPYVPGRFADRELPCLRAVLDRCFLRPDVLVVDGNAWNGPDEPGLGAHLWRALGQRVPVVGVAKSRFRGASALPVRRGDSERPLWVTAAGMDPAEAAAQVAAMAGPHRIPRLLRRVDSLARGHVSVAGA